MSNPERLIVVGPSASGKTTLVNGLRTPVFEDTVVIPKRFITRSERLGDSRDENQHVDEETFAEGVANGQIFPHWERALGLGKTARYGFEKADSDERLAVYSANNAFLRDIHPSLIDFVRSSVVVFVHASDEVRMPRMRTRSPDLHINEVFVRLRDDGSDILHFATEVIDTTGLSPLEGQAALINTVDAVVNGS